MVGPGFFILVPPHAGCRRRSRPFHRVPVMARAMADSDSIRTAPPFEAVVQHSDDVLDALVFADQARAGDRSVINPVRRMTTLPPSSCSPIASRRATVSGFRPP